MFDDALFKPEERAVFLLRTLYSENGFTQYKMGKFEDYDLYAKNRDFLISDSILTFTDTNGRLKALKPDVTLSIIRNTPDKTGEITKVFYNENVYRVSKSSPGFREIMQTGLECIGDIGANELFEVLMLAAKSLELLGGDCILNISHLDIVSCILSLLDTDGETRAALMKCLGEKNLHGIDELCRAQNLTSTYADIFKTLAGLHGSPAQVLPVLSSLLDRTPAVNAFSELKAVLSGFSGTPQEAMLRIDFSAVSDLKYYNGIAFKGYLGGIPGSVLSGGQYNNLMRRMRRRSGAIGFAVYLDMLEHPDMQKTKQTDEYLNIALPKGRLGEKVYAMFASAGCDCPAVLENTRKLIFENSEKKIRFFWVKPSDVAIYVERGAADLGVAGKDILLEYAPDVYELLDLQTGVCRMAVAAKKDFTDDPAKTLRVATKFSNIAADFYAQKGRDIDIIHLNGSIELAPILELSDVIVDIVETGTTLKENHLEVKENVAPISARLIANPSSFQFKYDAVTWIVDALAYTAEKRSEIRHD
ncbi:MAG: ATP phosphoribosyltransferase [Clostridia bacterium]|nr:ATP phosphoribosyltransferase [Clostridia bacterium]